MHPTFLISYFILAVLFYGSYSDLKTRMVSNRVTGMVWVASIPLVYFNYTNISWINGVFVLGLFILYFTNQMGGADLKVLIPLIMIVPEPVWFIMLLGVFGVLYAIISRSEKIPYFVPITASYWLIIHNIFMR